MRHTILQAIKRSLGRFGTSEYKDPPSRISSRRLQCEPLEDRQLLSITPSISGFVYCDINDNGVRDAAEVGVPGALVTLIGTDDQGNFVEISRLSGDDGSYLFEDLEPGTYAIEETQPEAFLDGQDTIGSLGGDASNDRFSNIVLGTDDEGTEYDFGEGRLRPQFASLRMLLASRPSMDQYLRETVADGEEQAGRTDLAESIRQGATVVSNELLDKAPIAFNDTYTIAEDAVLERTDQQGVLANDLDVDRKAMLDSIDTSDYVLVTVEGPAHGQLVLNDDGSFTYTPDGDYNGTDSFTYMLTNGTLDSNQATVALIVTPVNDPPVAVGDAYSVDEDAVLVVDAAGGVLDNDTDVESDTLTAVLIDGPQHGTLSLGADGSFTYTPDADYFGSDQFTYKANDGSADSNEVTVAITVNSVNEPPLALPDSYQLVEDGTLTVTTTNGLLANDTDEENDPLTAVLVDGPQHGNLSLQADGSFVYTPEADFFGSDQFTYQADDGIAGSGEVTVTIAISGVNDVPVAADDAYTVDEDNALVIDDPDGVLDNDTDADGDPLTVILITGTQHGALSLDADGSFVYTPAADYFGTDDFTYKINDGSVDSNEATVTITVNSVNEAPVATAESYEVDEDGTLSVSAAEGVLQNDSDEENDPLTAILGDGPQHGTLALEDDGSFVYAPDADYFGPDQFTYRANDGDLDSNEVTVAITVHGVNGAPVAAADSYQVEEDSTLTVTAAQGVLENDTDEENDPLTAILGDGPQHGTLSLDADGSFTYTPEFNYYGTDQFTYKANDGLADSNEVTVTITVNRHNETPVAEPDAYEVDEDGTLVVTAAEGVLANDTDGDNDPLIAILDTGPQHGALQLQDDGSFEYVPVADFSGTDSFVYAVNDGFLGFDEATVTITVNPINDPPVADPQDVSTEEDASLQITLTGDDGDPETDQTLSFSLGDGPMHGTLSGFDPSTGVVTYTPADGYVGQDVFTFTVNDGEFDSAEAYVIIDVIDVTIRWTFSR